MLLRLISLELLKELSKFLAVEIIHLPEYGSSVEEIRLQLVLCVWRFTVRFWLLFENCRLRNFRTLLDFFCYFGNLSNYFRFHLFFWRIFRILWFRDLLRVTRALITDRLPVLVRRKLCSLIDAMLESVLNLPDLIPY